MVWLSNRRVRATTDAPRDARARFRESTPRAFALRLAVMLGLSAITPNLHLRSLATVSAAAGVLVAYGAVCARERPDAPRFTAWDETVAFLAIAWLAFRLF